MSDGPDLERRIRDWLRGDVPARAPERLLEASLDQIARVGQERYLTQRLFGDGLGRSPLLRWALLAVALAIALLGVVAVAGGRPPGPAPRPLGAFTPGPSLATPRGAHTATLLRDGRVLVVGGLSGQALDSAELWDPITGLFGPVGSTSRERWLHTATLLRDGRVLLVGGDENGAAATWASAELWDPATGSFSPTGSLAHGRTSHTATLLPDGRVLIIGGNGSDGSLATAEIWDPVSGSFRQIAALAQAHSRHTATLLPDGRVLVAGGGICAADQAELWDPATETFRSAGFLAAGRWGHTATLLPDGRVLIVGGSDSGNNEGIVALTTAELWDPVTESFGSTGPLLEARESHTATLLADGRVLVVGGWGTDSELATAEVWDPETRLWRPTGPMVEARASHTATVLPDGRVFVVGGWRGRPSVGTTEIWDPDATPTRSASLVAQPSSPNMSTTPAPAQAEPGASNSGPDCPT